VAFREVGVVEVLRGWLEGTGLWTVAQRSGVDRKTVRRYVNAAVAAGLSREAGLDALDDELIGAVIAAVRPVRPDGHGASWEALSAREQQIRGWVGRDGLSIVKVEELLARSGCAVPYRTLHRFAAERCGFRVKTTTMRVVDGEPGVECQIDFAQMGFLVDAETGRRRRVHALILTAVVSRHMFVWLTYSQTLSAVIAGCEAAWEFFGGVFKMLIPDNLKAVVTDADAVNPRLSTGWLDYAQHAGFGTDPARVCRRTNPGSSGWCSTCAATSGLGKPSPIWPTPKPEWSCGVRIGPGCGSMPTTTARPAEMFAEVESRCLLPIPASYDVPIFSRVKVHRDFHVEIARSLYSVPEHLQSHYLHARADSELVKLFAGGALVKTHPRQSPGGRSTDPGDLPAQRAGYAMRDLTALITSCTGHGPNIGITLAHPA
jgi:hypothetical protein